MSTPLPAIAFIGGGNMASAMIGGLSSLTPRPSIVVSEPDAAKRERFRELGCQVTGDNLEAIARASLVVLAIKPQLAASVVAALRPGWTPDKLLVSILAGMPTTKLAGWLPPGSRVVRAMPNTPLAIGQGMVGLCRGAHASGSDLDTADALFQPCAKVLRLADEGRMDAITAVSGSGPAYVFAFAEAWLRAAEGLGFSREEAMLLVGQTGVGSWTYLMQSGFAATTLREQVTSPGGTTAAALQVLTQEDFTGMLQRALQAAERRGKELASLG
jgi:pyrroline-5-carboxylate reductase